MRRRATDRHGTPRGQRGPAEAGADMFDEYIERPSILIRYPGQFSHTARFLRFDRPVAVPLGPTTCVPLHYDRQRGPAD
jgi:hypothetical protein